MKKAWWKCKNGHEWQAQIHSRTGKSKSGCPYCSHNKVLDGFNDFATNSPELIKEWNYGKNNEIGIYPNKILPHTIKKVWWLCPQCGNSYKASPSCRIRGTGCPKCANEITSSFPEQAIYYYMKQFFDDTVNREKIDSKEIDVFIPSLKIGIEYDGIRFHRDEQSIQKEINKYRILSNNGIYLIRVKEEGVYVEESVADEIILIKPQHTDKELTICIRKTLSRIMKLKHIQLDISLIDVTRDRIAIYNNYIKTKKENSLEALKPDLIKEWNYNKNGNLKPSMFTINSEKKVWWICSKGHEWMLILVIEHQKM